MRTRTLAFIALLSVVPLSACTTGAESGASIFKTSLATKPGTVDAGEAAVLISQYRRSRGLPPVTIDATLTRIAAVHANRMAAADTMTHVLPGEGSFTQRLAAGGFVAAMAAENVAAGQKTLADALDAWRKSPGHNANLLLPNISKIGIALAVADDSKYKTYWSLVLGEWYVPRAGQSIGGPDAGPVLPAGGGVTVEIH